MLDHTLPTWLSQVQQFHAPQNPEDTDGATHDRDALSAALKEIAGAIDVTPAPLGVGDVVRIKEGPRQKFWTVFLARMKDFEANVGEVLEGEGDAQRVVVHFKRQGQQHAATAAIFVARDLVVVKRAKPTATLEELRALAYLREMNDRYLDLLGDVLDAKAAMRAAGCEQAGFAQMFADMMKKVPPQYAQGEVKQ